MLVRWLSTISIVSFCLLSLVILQMTKRPLCIDSKVVEKVDRLQGEASETVFRCALNKPTPYSAYFGQEARAISYRIQQIERLLESIEPFGRRVQVTIFADQPYLYRVHGHRIYIGSQLLEAPGHLEKALAKIWYRERNEALFAQQVLMEEIVTDFLVFLLRGDLGIGDPDSRIETAVRRLKWPFMVKSVGAYCASPWKQSEHFAVCRDPKEWNSLPDQKVLELSLRPLLVGSWIRSYMKLNVKERFQFVQALPVLLASERNPGLPLTNTPDASGLSGSQLIRAAEAIKNVNSFVSNSKAGKDSSTHRLFVASLMNDLRLSGFDDAFAEASFDVLYVSQKTLTKDSKVLAHLLKISRSHPQLQLALKDKDNLWMLPSRFPIPLKSFGQIKASRTVVEKCGGYNFSYVMDYSDLTEKLLVVDRCEPTKDILYSRYLLEGAEGFGAENPGISFVQFHLPSLLMKRAELEPVASVFEFIQKRDVENASFKSLGWKEVQWSKDASAYRPKGFVDAIEWFRVPN